MPDGSQRAKNPAIRPTIAIVVLFLWVIAACSSGDDSADAALSPAPASTEGQPPTAVEAPQDGADPVADDAVADDAETTISPAVLNEDAFASVVTLDDGERAQDVAGAVLTAYGVHRLPDDVITQLADHDLFGQTEDAFRSSFSPAIVDIGMCAAGLNAGAGDSRTVEFSLFSNTFDEYVEQPAVFLNHPIAYPGFTLPDPGECSRGWLLVQRQASSPTTVRYLVSETTPDGDIDRHLYQWSVPFSDVLPSASDARDDRFGIGQVITFNDGPLVGTTVTFKGWAEVVGATTPLEQTRLVAVRAEVCTATEDWPEFGLGIEGWNLLGPIDPGDRLGADPLAPLAGSCFEDWIEFAVPFGTTPSSFFVADGLDPVNGYAEWSLADAAIAPPS